MTAKNLVQAQRSFFLAENTKPLKYRIRTLEKLRKLLKENEQKFYRAIYEDFGKSKYETYQTELSLIYHEINTAIKNLPSWAKQKKVSTNLPNLPGSSYIMPEPYGVCLVTGAWNYPYQLSLIPLISAVAAGNTVVLKPSELAGKSSQAMAHLINDNFPTDFLHVYEGGVAEATELLEQKFDKIFFTGSIPVGKIYYKAAAKHLTPVTLELGGKSPVFVLPDCDLKTSAKRIVWGKFLNAGQTCVAPDYVLLHKNIRDEFYEEVKTLAEKLYDFKERLPENYVRIINKKNYERLMNLTAKAKVLAGGAGNPKERIIYPTILRDVDFNHPIMEDEIFGPILPIIEFNDLQKTIDIVKRRDKPLALYIFGKDSSETEKIISQISFGGGAVNDTVMHLTNGSLPFGGVGSSGIGNYHDEAGFKAFSHYKSILEKSTLIEPSLKYPPYNKLKFKILKKLLERP